MKNRLALVGQSQRTHAQVVKSSSPTHGFKVQRQLDLTYVNPSSGPHTFGDAKIGQRGGVGDKKSRDFKIGRDFVPPALTR